MTRARIKGQSRLTEHHLRSLLAVRPLERVYEGRGRGPDGRPSIVRQLLPGLPAEQRAETAEVFVRHMERLSDLSDPGTLPVLEYVTTDDGPLYYVTRMPAGVTLGEIVRDAGSLPVGATCALGAAIARRLEHAHARGVLHLALQRDRVLVSPEPEVTLLDLGIVPLLLDRAHGRLRRVHLAWDSLFPEPGAVAPEVLAGDAPGPATDVYGLGALLHLMCTAVMPYSGRAVVVYNAILSGREPADPRRELPDLDPALADLITACLSREPAARPKSVADVRERLEALAPRLEEALAPLAPIIKARPYGERFRPLLRVVEGSDADHAPEDDDEPAPGVVSLFSDAPPMSEAELLARMSHEQRQIYLAGSGLDEPRRKSRRGELRRGVIFGFLLAVIGLLLLLPQLLGQPGTGRRGTVTLGDPADDYAGVPVKAPRRELATPSRLERRPLEGPPEDR